MDIYKLPKLNYKGKENLNRSVYNMIESVIKGLPIMESVGLAS